MQWNVCRRTDARPVGLGGEDFRVRISGDLTWLKSLRSSFFYLFAIVVLSACSGGKQALKDFLGPALGENKEEPNYIFEFDPKTWDFEEVLTTTSTALSKTIKVKNPTKVPLFLKEVKTTTSTHFTITNETCTLLAGGITPADTCEFTVNFKPMAAGKLTFNVSFNFGLTNGDGSKSSVFTAVGLGASPADLLISDGPTYDFGPVVVNGFQDKTLTITNNGTYQATNLVMTGLALPFEFKGSAYPGTGGTCGTTLNGTAACTIVISFKPLATGLSTSTLSIDFFNGNANSNATRGIQGTGSTPAVLTVSDAPSYDFGTLPIGATLDKTMTISNSGGVPARSVSGSGLSAPFSFKGGIFPGTGGNCGAQIEPATSCQIVVTYAPTATGTSLYTINIGYNDGLTTQNATRNISGTAVTPGLLSISDGPTYNFGTVTVGSVLEKTFTMNNSGGYNASVVTSAALTAPYGFKGGTFPGTGGTCGSNLGAGGSCLIVVTYSPVTAGTSNATITVTYNNGVATGNTTRAMAGVAITPAVLTISNNPTYDFGTKPTGSSTDATLTVNNTGGAQATAMNAGGLATPFSFKGGTYPGTGGTCGATLNSAATCTMVITYAPTATGAQVNTVTMAYNDGLNGQTVSRTVQGNAVGPAVLAVSDGPTYDFGSQPIGKSNDKTLTITNTGGYAASAIAGSGLNAPYSFKGGSFPGTGGTCTANLAPAANCTVVVNYTAAAAMVSNATTNIAYNDGNGMQNATRDLTATGVLPASLSLSDGPTYDYGPTALGSIREKTFAITNDGGFSASSIAGAAFAAPFRYKGSSYPGTGGTCAGSLAPAATCTVIVEFAPTATGFFSANLQLDYSNGAQAVSSTRAIQGIGTSPAQLIVSDGPTYNFSTLPYGASTTKMLTITNSGGVAATAIAGSGLSTPFTFLGGSYPGTGGNCGTTLAASATCNVVVEFAPTATGTFNATMQIAFFDTVANQTATRALQGIGVNPANLSIDQGPSFDFGTVAVGGVKEQAFTVTNSGQVAASSIAGAALGIPFAYKGGTYPGMGGTCGTSLNVSATCTIVVTYSPVVTGAQSATLQVNYNDGAAPRSTTRSMSGTGATPASIAISDSPTYDFGTIATGATAEKTFTLTNSGGFGASSMTGGGLASPFVFKGGTYPGAGGTCGATLASGANCTVVVAYGPTAVGTSSSNIQIGYHDGANAQSASRGVTGTAVAPATLAISDGPTYDFGSIPVGSSGQKSLTVTNTGTISASAMAGGAISTPFSFKGGSYPGTGGSCAANLAPAANCTIVVLFSPTATGTFNGSVQLTYNDGANAQATSRALQGVGASAGLLSISDGPTYDFGSWPSGVSRDKTLTITNTGGVGVSAMAAGAGLAAPFSFKDGSYPGTGGTCAATLASNGTCTIVLTFSPTAINTFNSTVSVTYNDGIQAQSSSRAVTGTGVGPAVLTLSDGPTYDYGPVATGASRDKTFTVTNGGGFPATSLSGTGLTSPFSFKGGSFPGTGGTCAGTLNASATCTVVVTYAPATTGLQSSTVGISYNDGVGPQTGTRAVQGSGAAPALLTVSDGPTYDFGILATGSSADKAFTVTNSGGVVATGVAGGGLSGEFSFKGGTFPGTGGTCGATLAASATCTYVVTFAPTATGTPTATATVSYNDGVLGQTATRAVTGTGVPPGSLFISDGPTYDFSTVAIGAVKEKSFTVTNNGAFTATSMAGTGLTAPFAFKGGSYPGLGGTCGTSLNASGTCTVIVTYTPTVAGNHTSTFNINFFDGSSNQSTSRTSQGTGAAPAALAVSDGPTYDFGTRATGSTTDKTLNITNSGGVAATTVAGSNLSAPFTFKGGTYPGTGGTCGATINASATCTVIVNYSPTATGSHSGTMNISYQDGIGGQAATRAVQGFGAAPASLAVSDGPTYDYGTIAAGGFLDKTLTITNSGGVSATSVTGGGLVAPFGFKGGSYPGSGGTCAATLSASGTCTVVVTFAPSVGGTFNGTMNVSYNDGVTTQSATRGVTGSAVAPATLSVSDGPTFDFGAVPTTGSADKVFTVTNTGSIVASSMVGTGLTAPFSYKGGTYPGTGGTCGTTLNAAATCTVTVTFAPTANGPASSTITINFFDGANPQSGTRAVQGTGALPANLSISDGPTYSFGNLANGSAGDKSFTVTNAGGVPATAIAGGALAAPYSFKGGTYPGTGGTCAAALAAAGTCTVIVTYSPTSLGTQNTTLWINYTDGLTGQSASRPMTGTSVPPATLSISDGPTFDFGIAATGATVEKSFTVTNTGSFTASAIAGAALSAPFTYKGGTYPGTGGTCATTLNVAANCTVVVTWSPTATGIQTGTLQLNYFDGSQNQSGTRPVQGTGAAPALLTLSDNPSYDFGTTASGSTTDKTLTVTNTGGVGASAMSGSGLAAPFSFKGGTYPGTGGTCAATLTTAGTCTIVVSFAPTVAGTFNDTIDITYNNGATAQTSSRDIAGTGTAPAILNISDATTYDFGVVPATGSADKVFTVTNAGNLGATSISGGSLSAPYSFKGGSFPGTGGTCGASLAASATCTVVVTFNPSAVGSYNGTLDINYHNGVGMQVSSRPMQGVGAPPASITISDGPTYNYGNLANGSSGDKTFTLTNSGGVPATAMSGGALTAPYAFKGGTYPGTGGTCAAILAVSGTCTIVVSYSPTSLGTQASTVTVNYTDGLVGQTASRAVTGTSVAPALLAYSDGPTYDFGIAATGASVDHSFTVTNTGSFTASALAGVAFAAPFAYKGGTYPGTGGNCGSTLAVGANCTIVVTWSPTATGIQSGTAKLDYYDGAQSQQSTRPIQGTGASPALLGLSDGPTFDYGTRAAGSANDKSFTVSNTGGVTATAMSGSGLAAPFSFKGGTYPGAGGSCGATLATGANCTVVVTFSPTAGVTSNDTIDITYVNGVSAQTSSRDVVGTGTAPATLTISDGATYDFGSVPTTGLKDKVFTVNNTGNVDATAVSGGSFTGPFSFKGGSFPGTGGTCAASIAVAANCTVVVTFAPTVTGSFSSSLDIIYNNGVTSVTSSRALQGTGAPPAALTISDGATYNYGNLANGSSADKTFTVTNSGGVPATAISGAALTAPFAFKGGSFPGTGGTCAATLAAAGTCTVVVTYSPTSLGTQSGTLTVNFTDGLNGQSSSRPITGTSVAPASLTFSDGPTYDFGLAATGASVDKILTVTNGGSFNASAMAGVALSAPFAYKGGSYPGTGGTCGTNLAVAANCTVVVTWSPTATGLQSATVRMDYFDGALSQQANRPVQGTGAAPALLTLSDGPIYDYGTKASGSSTDKSFTVTNSGGVSATSLNGSGLAAPYSFKGGTYPGTGGTCGAALASSANCTVVVTFAPTGGGTMNDTLDITYHDGASSQTASRDITGAGTAPATLTISDGTTYDFGAVPATGSKDKVFTVSNTGNLSATSVAGAAFTAPFSFKGGSFPGSGGTCGASIAAAANCTVVVTFNPSVVGSFNGTLQINYDNGVTTVNSQRALQGVGAPPATLSISDGPTYNYGNLANGSSGDKMFTITNTGGVPATALAGGALTAPFAFKGGSYPGTGGSCAATVAPAGTCTVVVTYSPTSLGTQNTTLSIDFNDGLVAQTATRAITGTSVAPASLAFSDGPTYDYGTAATGASVDKTLTITNSGAFTASSMAGVGLAAPFTFKGGTYPGAGGTCALTLGASSTCTVVVTWAPTATGIQTGTARLDYFDGAQSQQATRPLQGSGAAPALLTVSDGPSFDYGTQAIGSVNDKSFTVSNSGGVPSTGMSGSGLAAPFAFKGGNYPGTGGTCGATLAPAANCTVVATFSPTASGPHSDTMDITYTNGVSVQTASRDLVGAGTTPANLIISDGATFDFGAIAATASTDKVFTVNNSGSLAATSISGYGLSAPFTFKGGTFPGTGGTCGATLAPAANCTFVVTFNPTVLGSFNATVSLDFNNGASVQTSTRPMQGVGATPANITISDGVTFNYGNLANGSFGDKSFTLTNSGGVSATAMAGVALSAPFAFKGGSYPGTGGTCNTTLLAAGTCTIVVTYSPTSLGTHNTTVSVNYTNGLTGQTASRDVTGTSVAPALLGISDGPSYDYGSLAVGASLEKSFTITNSGAFTATAMTGAGLTAPFTFKGGTYPGTGGTCAATLAARGTCTVVVRWSPTATGSQSGTLQVDYFDGAAAQSATRGVQGTGTAPANLTISDGPTFDYGLRATGSNSDKVFTVTNTGGNTATSISGTGLLVPFAFKGGTFPGTGGTCTATLNAAASCDVVVTFSPVATGPFSSSVSVSYFDGVNNQNASRAVQGTGVGPAVLVVSDGPTFDFGPVATTGSADKVFTVTNTGGLSATSISAAALSAPYTFKGGNFPGSGGTCAATLAASAACTFVVTFNPTANGSSSSSISISYNDQAQTQSATRGMQGTGAPPANITLSDGPTYSFGTLANGGVGEKALTLTNGGGVPATALAGGSVSAPFGFKGGSYPGTGGTCAATLGVSATCTIVVMYSPTSINTHTGSVSVNYTDGLVGQTATRNLSGTAVAPALLAISDGPTYDYGTLATGATADHTFTVTNNGSFSSSSMAGAGVSGPFTFKGGTYPGTAGTCAAALAPAASCTIVVTYAPTSSGAHSSNAAVSYNDGAGAQTASRAIFGTGAAPSNIIISDGAVFNFGSVANGSINDKTFTLSNSGGVAATAMSGSGLTSPFSFKGGTYPGAGGTCGTSLAASGTCTVVVSYAPTSSGTQSSSLDITFDNGSGTGTSSRSMQGTSTAPALLTVSDGATYNYGNVANGSVNDHTFVVTNSGGFTASTLAGSGLSAPFTFKGGTYPGSGGNCSLTLAASATCTVVVTFAPVASATHNGSFDIAYHNGVTTLNASRAVQGISTPPASLSISDGPTYDFGSIAVTASADKTFTITNGGGYIASTMVGTGLTSPFSYKGGTYPGTGGTCGATLAASANCTIVVTYAPTATGSQNGTISITHSDGAAAQNATRAVTGIGVAPALIGISDGPTYDYGPRATGGSTDKIFTLINTGGLGATSMSGGGLAAPYAFKGGSYPGTGGTCGAALSPSTSCIVVVTYAPVANGATTDDLDISYNNGVNTQTSSRTVQGTGVPPAVLTISDGLTYDYGAVATTGSADKVFTLSNSGGFGAAAISANALSAPFGFKGGSFPGTGGTCGATLAASGSCTFVVTFSPTVGGSASGTISLNYDSGATTAGTTRGVQGTGAPPANITISDGATYDFGTIANGGVAEKAFTLTNGGGVTATAMAGGTLNAPYSFKGGSYPGTGGTCTATLGTSGTCTIVVVYSPTSIGTQNSTVVVNYFDGLNNVSASRAVTGSAVAPAALAINNGPTYDYGTLATGSSLDATFTVTNNGNYSAASMSGAGLSGPYTFKGGTYPGIGGTCGASLAVSASCTMVVTWAPTATGSQSSTLQVAYFDGAQAQTSSRPVTGTGVAPALLTVSDGPAYSFGPVANGSVNDKSFTITNSGGLAATAMAGSGLSAPFTFKGGTYPGTGGSCTTTLNASATCTIVVTFAPTITNSYSNTMTLAYNNGVIATSATRDISGSSAAPAVLTISDAATYDFGNKANGSTTDKTFTMTNSGGTTAISVAAAALSAPYSYKGGTFPGSGGNCGITVGVGATCSIVVTFAPTASGTHNQTLTVNYNDGVSALQATRPMTGVSTAPAQLTISGTGTYDFGTRATGTATDASFTVTNSGSYDASSMSPTALTAPFSFKGGTYPGTGGTCGSTLSASSNCSIVVTYSPTATGSHSDTITMNYNDGAAAQSATRPVQGVGAAPATITISDGPGNYDYGTVASGSNSDKSFTLNNSGGFAATAMSGGGLSAPFSFKGGSYPGTGGNCGATLAAGGNCTVVVTFGPSANGSYSSSVDISYNTGVTTTTASRGVQGVGASPAVLTISDGATYDYSEVAVGGSADKTFTVSNTGGITASSVAPTALSAPFSFKGGSYPGTGGNCGATINIGANCTIVVTFAPTATGPASTTITMNYNNGISASTANRPVQGTGSAPASLSISDATTYDFGSHARGASVDHTFTVSNSGGVAAGSIAGAALTAPFSYKGGSFPGTGATCTTTLAKLSSCTVIVTYSPSATGSHSGTLQLNYNDGVNAQNTQRPMQGTAVTPAILTINNGPSYDFGTYATGASVDATFTVNNSGAVTATSLAGGTLTSPFSFKGGSYPGTGGTCNTTLAPAASCTVVLTFAPSSTGTHSDTLTVNYFDGAQGQTAQRDINGTASAPALITISDGATFNYGEVANGGAADKSFTVTNTGGVNAIGINGGGLSAPFSYKGGSFPGTGGNCSATLGIAANCTIVVTFAPTLTNTYNSTITIGYNDGAGVQSSTRAITGTSAAAAVLGISDGPTYNYGTIVSGGTVDKGFTITNTGGVTASALNITGLTSMFVYKGGTYPGTGGTCSATLAPSSNCLVVIQFAPSSTGSHNATITLGYNDGATTQSTNRPVQGVASTPAILTVSNGPTYDYGTMPVGATAEFTFSISNSGGVQATSVGGLSLSSPYAYKGGTYPGTAGTCSTSLNASASCTIVVVYSPNAAGTHNANVGVNFFDGAVSQSATRAVTGTAVNPALIGISDGPTYNFGSQPVSITVEKALTLTNTGNWTATSLSAGTLTAPFAFKGGTYPGTGGNCSTTLNASASCTIIVTYHPVTTGSHANTVSIGYNDGVSAQNSTRDLAGTGATTALLTISDAVTYDYGDTAVNGSADKTFTITNSGGVTASSLAGSGLSGDYSFKGGNFPGTGGTCTASLTSSNTCTIVVTFAPTVTGLQSRTLTVNYNDGLAAQSATRPIQGTGQSRAFLSMTPAGNYDYGNLETLLTSNVTFTISNSGTVAATLMSPAALTAPFSYANGTYPGFGGTCAASLPGLSSCTIVVRFSPTETGVKTDTISIQYNDSFATQTLTKNIQGTGIAPAPPSLLTRLSPTTNYANTSSATIRVAGVNPNDTVKLFTDFGCTQQVASGVVGAGQNQIDITWASINVDQLWNFYANRTNSGGTVSACSTSSVSFTRDTVAPVVSTISNFSPGQTPYFNATPVMRIAGNWNGDAVSIYSDSGCTTLVTTQNNVFGTSVDITIPTIASDGLYTYYAKAIDFALNTSSCTATPVTYRYDATDVVTQFTSYSQYATEGGSNVTVGLTMSQAKAFDITVNYKTSGTAVSGTHVSGVSASGSVTFTAGQTTQSITFSVPNNALVEKDKYLDFVLTDSSYEYVHVAGKIMHRVVIEDDDQTRIAPVSLPTGYGAGYNISCYINSQNKLYCLGKGGWVGDGTTVDRENWVQIDSSNTYALVSVGQEHVCAVTLAGTDAAGTVKCWGNNTYGMIGDNSTTASTIPVAITTNIGVGVKKLSLGQFHTCAISSTDKLYCWGRDNNRQATGTNSGGNRRTPYNVDGSFNYIDAAAGATHTCAVRAGGDMTCFGADANGRTGMGNTSGNTSSGTTIDTGVVYTAVMVNDAHSCGITSTGAIKCWGSNNNGRAGLAGSTQATVPMTVDTGTSYTKLATGRENTCGVTTGGNLKCTGRVDYGAEMDRLTVNNDTMTAVQVGTTFVDVTAGYQTTWARNNSNRVIFGGLNDNYSGAGDGKSAVLKFSTAAYDGTRAFTSLDRGMSGYSTCHISNNRLRCVGNADQSGYFGMGSSQDVFGYIWPDAANSYSMVATSTYHMCAIRTDGKLFCAGNGTYNGANTPSSYLVAVDSGQNYATISAGVASTCGITTAGVLKCWGLNDQSQLGNGNTTTQLSPQIINSGTTYSKVSVGNKHACGITTAGVLKCWGWEQDGRLGNGTNGNSRESTPVVINSGTTYAHVAAGDAHTCAITTAQKVRCWGLNTDGRLGDNSTTTRTSPVNVDNTNNYISIAAGDLNTCAVRADNNLYCWGSEAQGIVNAAGTMATTPVIADGANLYTAVTMGRTKACGLTTVTSNVRCWGNNKFNAFGDTGRQWLPQAIPAPGFTSR